MLREKIFVVLGKTDMRKGIDGLAAVAAQFLEGELFDKNSMFLFCGTKKDRYKILCWEKDGFSLTYKRLENGKLKWPKEGEENICQLTHQQYRWLTEGLFINQPKSIKEAKAGHLF